MTSTTPTTTCPRGSTILVTGSQGFIATHIIDILLRSGYAVKGTVRTAEKAEYIQNVFHARHPTATFTTVIIPDLNVPGATEDALQGCTGLIHTAHDLSMAPDFNIGFTAPVNIMKNILSSAAKTPSLKRFVFTSTIHTTSEPGVGVKVHSTSDTWNHDSLEKVQNATPPYADNYPMLIYFAAKVACEEAALDFIKQNQPGFVYNAILPSVNTGPILTQERPLGSAAFMLGVYYGAPEAVGAMSHEVFLSPQTMVDVRDTAWLHVLALTEEDVKSERVMSASGPFTYNRVVGFMGEFAPEGHKVPGMKEGMAESGQTIDDGRSLELLKRAGRVGWAPVVDALRENCLGEGK